MRSNGKDPALGSGENRAPQSLLVRGRHSLGSRLARLPELMVSGYG